MRILDEWETFIHTHFQTDGEQLPSERVREIERALVPTLRELGIVYGFHLERSPSDPGIRVVVECRPGKRELQIIRQKLADTLRPIPRRPRPTIVRFASEEIGSCQVTGDNAESEVGSETAVCTPQEARQHLQKGTHSNDRT